MAAKGKPKDPGSGRKAGTPNKKTQDLIEICEQEGCEPFRGMVKLAMQEKDPSEQFIKFAEIAHYIYPKRKAVEHSGEMSEKIEVVITDYTKKIE